MLKREMTKEDPDLVERTLLIVAHGSPSVPEPQEQAMADIAARVQLLCPERKVLSATLAQPGALEAAVATLEKPIIYPHFMSDGWFVSTQLPRRLGQARLAEWVTTQPLGLFRSLRALALQELRTMLEHQGLPPMQTTLIVAAHGSPSDPRPAFAAQEFALALKSSLLFRQIRVGFVDEAPSLKEVATDAGPAIVLPFFAARAGHVLEDLPEALEAAGFQGEVMAPIGLWEGVPELVAEAVAAHAMRSRRTGNGSVTDRLV